MTVLAITPLANHRMFSGSSFPSADEPGGRLKVDGPTRLQISYASEVIPGGNPREGCPETASIVSKEG